MTIFPYDEFAKNYLEALLGTIGEVRTDKKVPVALSKSCCDLDLALWMMNSIKLFNLCQRWERMSLYH
ncbi:hypothetical protein NIES4071_55130 [Calothrix sp. NIES-4071]|nr:hypothetical protein NIES4071_55130 [Calothrix sp. NIES-4071]BAZ59820.1 hypothetical protein NIES4105_55080 [Calothrix sp. NIES-4105]